MKRKIISVLLTAAMVVSLAACGGGGNTSSESGGGSDNVQSSESGEADGELYTVTMVLNGTHNSRMKSGSRRR